MDYYEFVRGPLAYAAFFVFIAGSATRLLSFYLKGSNSKMLYPRENLSNGFKAILVGIVPFATRFMKKRPLLTLITFLFHICVIILPLFFLAHIVLWFESFEFLWVSIPDGLADVMTVFVLLGCIFFFVRRFVVKEVKMVTETSDYLLLISIFIVFLTGFMAFHQFGPYRPILILHIFSSEVLLIIIPFSRMIHMILYPFSRYYMGADFGSVIEPSDW